MLFAPEESCSHEVGSEINWNESMAFVCHDMESDISIYLRVAGRPNQRRAEHWAFVATPDGDRFRQVEVDLPYHDNYRRSRGFSTGRVHWDHEGDNAIRLKAEFADLHIDLVYHDFYPAQNGWKFLDSENRDYGLGQYTAHYECSGSVRGSLRLHGKQYEIANGLAHRDHSWGPRRDETRVARWVIGTVGPEFSHSIVSHIDPKGYWVKGGWIVRHGVVEHARALDIVAYQNSDGVSTRGGRAELILESGEHIAIDLSTRASFISFNGLGGSRQCEGVSTSSIGGLAGMACFTLANNATGVGEEIKAVCDEFATLAEGHSRAPASSSMIVMNGSSSTKIK